jgi:hypothetical protein
MRRLHLLEIEDQPWCPAVLHDAATDFLQFMIVRTDTCAPAVPLLRSALERAGTRQVVDLCSGGGGPWPELLPRLYSLRPRYSPWIRSMGDVCMFFCSQHLRV